LFGGYLILRPYLGGFRGRCLFSWLKHRRGFAHRLSCIGDFSREAFIIDCAIDQPVANDEGRCAGDSGGARQGRVGRDLAVDFRVVLLQVGLQPLPVDASLFRRRP
jgi:hypothetical protein